MTELSDLFNGPPESWPDRIVFVSDGSGPPRWHVRDQEALTRALPPCEIAPADRAALAAVHLDLYPATLWLPTGACPPDVDHADAEDAGEIDGTDGHVPAPVQSWNWPNDDLLSVMITTSPDLPGRRALTQYDAEDERAELGGRPMRVRRYTQAGEGTGTVEHYAVVDGFLDDGHEFYGCVLGSTAATRDALLAALLTLTPHATPSPAQTSQGVEGG